MEGRDFSPDDRGGSEQVLVVNSSFAKAVWPGESAVGKCFRLQKATEPCRRVVGVVSNSHFSRVIERPSMQFYVPLAQDGDGARGPPCQERWRFGERGRAPREWHRGGRIFC